MRWLTILVLVLGFSPALSAQAKECFYFDAEEKSQEYLDHVIEDCNTEIAHYRKIQIEAIKEDLIPSYSQQFKTRARAYEAKGDFEKAIRDLNEAVSNEEKETVYKRTDTRIETLCYRGEYYVRRGEAERAIADFDRAINDYKYSFKCFIGRGEAYLSVNAFDMALTDVNSAISVIDGNSSGFKGMLNNMLKSTPAKESRLRYETQFKATAMGVRGEIFEKKGDCAAAAKEFAAALSIAPNDKKTSDAYTRAKSGCPKQ